MLTFFFFGRNIPKTMSKGEEENRNLSAPRYLPFSCSKFFTLKMVSSTCFCRLCEGYLSNLFASFVKNTCKEKSVKSYYVFVCLF